MKHTKNFKWLTQFVKKLFPKKEQEQEKPKPIQSIDLGTAMHKAIDTVRYGYIPTKIDTYPSGIDFQFELLDHEQDGIASTEKNFFLPNGETSLMFDEEELFWDWDDEALRFRPLPEGEPLELKGFYKVYKNGAFVITFKFAEKLSQEALDYSFGKNDEGYIFCWRDYSIAPMIFEMPAYFEPLGQLESPPESEDPDNSPLFSHAIHYYFDPDIHNMIDVLPSFTYTYTEKKGVNFFNAPKIYNQNLKNSRKFFREDFPEAFSQE